MDQFVSILSLFGIQLIAVIAVHLLVGFLGAIPLMHVSAIGIGAYSFAILGRVGWSVQASAVVSVLLGSAVMSLVGVLTSKVANERFSLASFGLHLLFYSSALCLPVTGGPMGIKGITPLWTGASDNLACFSILSASAMLLVFHSYFARTPFGRLCSACNDNPLYLVNLGLDPSLLRVQLLGGAGVLWAFCGVLMVSFTSYVDPNMFLVDLAISQLAVAFLAGRNGGSFRLLCMAALFFLLPETLRYLAIDPVRIGVVRDLSLGALILLWFKRNGSDVSATS